ncbi:membrane dipeptidase [Salegentibacter sp. UBA1130]|uniref:membrane dipeptidase n=1 Tax=Salegentibacter sp. UBA1130 TaxID=1947451 RepID=UPI0025811730|nr:membrane dipeptidase [Salegentibacter sp. UBA1130]
MAEHFFDSHLHATTKSFLSQGALSPWEEYKSGLDFMVGNIIDSQSCLKQLVEANYKLVLLSIIPIEKGFAKSWLIRNVLPKIAPLNKDYLELIVSEEDNYWQRFNAEFLHLKKYLKNREDVQIITSMNEYDDSKLNLVMSLEGGHSFFDREGNVIQNLKSLKKSNNRFFYVTLTHLTDFGKEYLSNHSYGSKLINVEDFKPKKYAISDLGYEFIDECYSDKSGKPILIDVKHMSLLARKKFYNYRKSKFSNFPIIASHCGVTGISWNQFKSFILGNNVYIDNDIAGVRIKKPIGLHSGRLGYHTFFNPWTINLFDEEIVEIIGSGGLIGLSIDQRILGYTSRFIEFLTWPAKEYIQLEEFKENFGEDFNFIDGELDPDLSDDEEMEFLHQKAVAKGNSFMKEKSTTMNYNKKLHTSYMVNNLLHIIKVGGEKAWDHICIGSDFDGMVNAINSCSNVYDMENFEYELIEAIERIIRKSNFKNSDFYITDLSLQIRKVMYLNGKLFMNKNFN